MEKLLRMAAIIIAGLVLFAIEASATIINFDAIASTVTKRYSSYSENGFKFTSNVLNQNNEAFASWGSSSIKYAGSQALFNLNYGGETTLSKEDGGSFGLYSIDLSELFNQTSYDPTPVVFTGQKTTGGTATYTANLDLVFGFEHFSFGNVFSDVTSVAWVQAWNYHQFDNVTVGSPVINTPSGPTHAVPEPASMLLLGLGLVGVAGIRRRMEK